jgi:hypothetical protein
VTDIVNKSFPSFFISPGCYFFLGEQAKPPNGFIFCQNVRWQLEENHHSFSNSTICVLVLLLSNWPQVELWSSKQNTERDEGEFSIWQFAHLVVSWLMGPSLVCVSPRLATSVIILHTLVQCNYLFKLFTILSSYLPANVNWKLKMKMK